MTNSIYTGYRQNDLYLKCFSSFLAFLQDFYVTFEKQLCNLKVNHSYKTLYVYIGFSRKLLMHVVKGLCVYSHFSLANLGFCTKELL